MAVSERPMSAYALRLSQTSSQASSIDKTMTSTSTVHQSSATNEEPRIPSASTTASVASIAMKREMDTAVGVFEDNGEDNDDSDPEEAIRMQQLAHDRLKLQFGRDNQRRPPSANSSLPSSRGTSRPSSSRSRPPSSISSSRRGSEFSLGGAGTVLSDSLAGAQYQSSSVRAGRSLGFDLQVAMQLVQSI